MKITASFLDNITKRLFRFFVILIVGILIMVSHSCQKYDDSLMNNESLKSTNLILSSEELYNSFLDDNSTLYFGHKIFKRGEGAPSIETVVLENPDFHCYDGNFILKIKNGRDKRTRVSSAELRIDGILIAGPSDFSKNVSFISKQLSGLKSESILEVKLNSTPGSYIDLWIEGNIIQTTPSFEQIGLLCQNSVAPELQLSSTNTPPITGTWTPATISTEVPGKTSYLFTPDEGQCAVPFSMDIEVINSTIPIFAQIGPIAQNSSAPELPSVSENGISGTWSPSTINTSTPGTFTFTFAPSADQCAIPATMEIQVTSTEITVTDIDGNIYKTVKIGEQLWMAENLKVTRYRNGDLIGTTTPATLNISGETEPKYQWAYNGIEGNADIYGRFYTWYVVADSRGVCPTGWHVPSDVEWTALTDYLTNNGYGFEGSGPDIAKSLAAKTGWSTDATPGNVGNDQESNNSSGFTALSSGVRNYNGTFHKINDYASWWSSTTTGITNVLYRNLNYNSSYVNRPQSDKKHGATIRCIRD